MKVLNGIFQFSRLLIAVSVLVSTEVHAEDKPLSMDALLSQVEQGRLQDIEHHRQRMASFRDEKGKQAERLSEIAAEQAREEALSTQQEKKFEENEQLIAQQQERLKERLGSLKELFGVLQQVASDAQGQFAVSPTQLNYPDRQDFLSAFAAKMGQTSELPSISEIEKLWFELHREMSASGEIKRFDHKVLNVDGLEEERPIIRVGSFNLMADGKFLRFIPETGRVMEYGRQPAPRYRDGISKLENAAPGEAVIAAIDPTRGQLLSLYVKAPRLSERVAQGGVIGYIIIALGVVSILTALVRLVYLAIVSRRINEQIKGNDRAADNPLSRILSVYKDNQSQDCETLELKLGEAVLREVPKINRGLSFLKIVAAVAPLLGLLGTVTGMIITFQAITLFGAGDPKLMAGGISQALVTTVLGLTVAIPTLLLHNMLQSRAQSINEILEQEGIAIVASKAEAANSAAV